MNNKEKILKFLQILDESGNLTKESIDKLRFSGIIKECQENNWIDVKRNGNYFITFSGQDYLARMMERV